jgi:putative heme iron utilization protein
MSTLDRAAPARALIQEEQHGVLCTISLRVAGWPFGSVTPYAMTSQGEPTILISEIAEHTKNLRADPRVSLFIQESAFLHDTQSGRRITLMGQATPVESADVPDARSRYLARFPNAEQYFSVHDFTLFKISTVHVRFIGGFGEIYWLEPNEVLINDATNPLSKFAAGICEHMNTDHSDALFLYAKAFAGLEASSAKMTEVDPYGFDMTVNHAGIIQSVRIKFPQPVTTTDEVRQATIALLKTAREQQQKKI